MRLILLFFGIITVAAAGVASGALPPPNQMLQAMFGPRGDAARVRQVSPLDAYNMVLPQIIRGATPEAPRLHGSAAAIPSAHFRTVTTAAVDPDAIGQNGFEAGALSQIQQNQLRMQDMTAFARNPPDWHVRPPN